MIGKIVKALQETPCGPAARLVTDMISQASDIRAMEKLIHVLALLPDDSTSEVEAAVAEQHAAKVRHWHWH